MPDDWGVLQILPVIPRRGLPCDQGAAYRATKARESQAIR